MDVEPVETFEAGNSSPNTLALFRQFVKYPPSSDSQKAVWPNDSDIPPFALPDKVVAETPKNTKDEDIGDFPSDCSFGR